MCLFVCYTDPYLVVPEGANVHVVLHKVATPQDFLRAYVHALYLADLQARTPTDQSEELAISWMQKNYTAFLDSVSWCLSLNVFCRTLWLPDTSILYVIDEDKHLLGSLENQVGPQTVFWWYQVNGGQNGSICTSVSDRIKTADAIQTPRGSRLCISPRWSVKGWRTTEREQES